MASGYISKNDFIRAYQWTYGTPQKEAEYIWSIASYEYKVEIIRGYTDSCKKIILQRLNRTTYPLV